ncbi:MAG TPA: hypothetical protein VMC84_06670 [Methanocella sp.]|uniref:hypothetical protein n=1 Tax=Methanocella sp. TaxID=2052833 RepID=UPI002BF0C03A|nr:hypothetical protein [Methanocella sp.]HTY90844.1 hypothetical protein [Methanocella sp.]
MSDNEYLTKYVDGFKAGLAEAASMLQENEHKDWDIQKYAAFYENKSNGLKIREGMEKGYDEGLKDAYATVGQDLHDYEFKEYSIEDYGKLYANIVSKIGDCLNCQDIGSDKGCEVGKTIWCTRLLETLKE